MFNKLLNLDKLISIPHSQERERGEEEINSQTSPPSPFLVAMQWAGGGGVCCRFSLWPSSPPPRNTKWPPAPLLGRKGRRKEGGRDQMTNFIITEQKEEISQHSGQEMEIRQGEEFDILYKVSSIFFWQSDCLGKRRGWNAKCANLANLALVSSLQRKAKQKKRESCCRRLPLPPPLLLLLSSCVEFHPFLLFLLLSDMFIVRNISLLFLFLLDRELKRKREGKRRKKGIFFGTKRNSPPKRIKTGNVGKGKKRSYIRYPLFLFFFSF